VASPIPVYLEAGTKRTFASAVEWPGWSRSGRDRDAALGALAAYGARYAKAIGRGRAAEGFERPAGVSDLEVVARLKGEASTDFGVPSVTSPADRRPLDETEVERLVALLRAAWRAFDRNAKRASGVTLRRGPRGGGRQPDAMVQHVLDAEGAYLTRAGGQAANPAKAPKDEVVAQMTALRTGFVEAITVRARGEPAPRPRPSGKLWTPRYSVRRSAWHSLDHAWEIEDRME
jgi:hypothetical protein